jgi:hypothetical protein
MAGIRQQGHRIAEQARDRFGDDEADVERQANGEGASEVAWRMVMPVTRVPMPAFAMWVAMWVTMWVTFAMWVGVVMMVGMRMRHGG